MPQTANGSNVSPNTPKPAQKTNRRPGQRQQERLQRLARRRRRNSIIISTITAVVLVILGSLGVWGLQTYTAQQKILTDAHATATGKVEARASATAIVKNCFITPGAPGVPSLYAAAGTPTGAPTSPPAASGNPVTLSGGLQYIDIKVGTGDVAVKGHNLTVEYSGWLAATCQKFQSSYDTNSGTPGTPFTFPLGKGQVIPGWDKGLVGMKVGGIRRLYIPSALGYGTQSNSSIPANSNLIFDVTLLSAN